MPTRPASRCSHPGCTKKATKYGACPQHQRPAWEHPSAHARLINPAAWRPVRLAILDRDHWTCVRCGRRGRIVDHIIPVGAGGALYDPHNLQTLCDPCNTNKNNEDRANYPSIFHA